MARRLGSFTVTLILVSSFVLVLTTKEAHAYIDIGSGSLMLQVLLATLFASIFSIKVFWRQLTHSASRLLMKFKNPRDTIEE